MHEQMEQGRIKPIGGSTKENLHLVSVSFLDASLTEYYKEEIVSVLIQFVLHIYIAYRTLVFL
jgi:hypothetical protein